MNANWDAVIVTHSGFERIPLAQETQRRFFDEQLHELDLIQREYADSSNRRLVKELERAKKRLEARLQTLAADHKKDNTLTFEELGVDRLFVDEAQENEKPTIRNAPATPELKEFVRELAARADRLKTGRVDPRVDNMLKVTSEGRKAALDLRLVQPVARDEPDGKVNLAVENSYVTEGSFDAYMWQTLETKAKFIAQVMSGNMTIRRLEDLDSAALTYAEVKAIASGNPLVIEKAQVDAELMRLTRLRSAHAEEQYRIRANLRRSHEDAEVLTVRLDNLRQDAGVRQDTSGDHFNIELDGQSITNRGVAGELIVRRAEKVKNRFGDDIRIGRFTGFNIFLRPALNNEVEIILRGKNNYSARVTDTALGTIRSLEATVQGFEERAAKLETDIADAHKRAKELEGKIGAPFEHVKRYQELSRRQSEIEEKLDLTKNQAPSQADATPSEEVREQITEKETSVKTIRTGKRSGIRV